MANNDLKTFVSSEIIKESVDMKKYIEELLTSLKNDTEVYNALKPLGLTNKEVRDNIGKLADFQEDFNICKHCKGFDKCPKANKHISMYIYKDGNYVTTRNEPCYKYLAELELEAKYVCRDFPNEWKKSKLKSLDLSENRAPVFKEFCNIADGKSNRWIYLMGNHKVGKSFLLATFANEFIALDLGQVAFINAPKQLREIADLAYSDKDEFKNIIEKLSSVPLLIVDEFGQEYKNEFIRDQIVIPVLNERSHNDKVTFFSSEFTIKEISKLYSVGKNGGEIRGKQLENLLTDLCGKEFDLTGASIYKKAN